MKYRQCEVDQPCPEYFDLFDEVHPDLCPTDSRYAKHPNDGPDLVASLLAKYFDAKDTREMQCPSCWTQSHLDSFDKYEECLLKAEGQEMADCEEGSDTCMASYLHYADDDGDVFCEAGRSCFPASYLNVNQLQQNSECHTDDCNNHKWTPWSCDSTCGEEYTKCRLECKQDPVCESTCLREFDNCLAKC